MTPDQSDLDRVRDQNRDAWNARRYDVWVKAMGPPEVEAHALVANPNHKLRRLLPYLGEVAGMQICNVQGSHGRVAVALALLGAEVTVLDFAEDNRRYALELAAHAEVAIDYRLGDVMEADRLGLEPFDAVVMELGVLHYHQSLSRFFAVMERLCAEEGRLLINEFHPVHRKLFQAGDGALGDYFNAELVVSDVPNPTGDARSLGQCAYRYWTLGEIVTGVVVAGFRVANLDEHPDLDRPARPRNLHSARVQAWPD